MLEFVALAQQCAPWVAPATLQAIVKTESNFDPLAIGINAGSKLSRKPVNKEEAVVTAKWLIQQGYNIDMGLGQVNSANLGKTGLSVEDAFDSCKNLAASATILRWNYEAAKNKVSGEQAQLHAALSAYNTGSMTKGFANGYVQKVVDNAPKLTQSPMQGASKGPAPSVAPIPLTAASAAPTTKVPPVKLTPEKPKTHSTDVYGNPIENVMVY